MSEDKDKDIREQFRAFLQTEDLAKFAEVNEQTVYRWKVQFRRKLLTDQQMMKILERIKKKKRPKEPEPLTKDEILTVDRAIELLFADIHGSKRCGVSAAHFGRWRIRYYEGTLTLDVQRRILASSGFIIIQPELWAHPQGEKIILKKKRGRKPKRTEIKMAIPDRYGEEKKH